jgi:hypothetical protein
LPAASVARAQYVVVLGGAATDTAKTPPVATAAAPGTLAMQAASVNSATCDPASALPCTLPVARSDAPWIALNTGAGGGMSSCVYASTFEQPDTLPAASRARAESEVVAFDGTATGTENAPTPFGVADTSSAPLQDDDA